jgi:hypothetical protein
MSAAVTVALSIITLPSLAEILIGLLATVVAVVSFMTSAAVTFPATT